MINATVLNPATLGAEPFVEDVLTPSRVHNAWIGVNYLASNTQMLSFAFGYTGDAATNQGLAGGLDLPDRAFSRTVTELLAQTALTSTLSPTAINEVRVQLSRRKTGARAVTDALTTVANWRGYGSIEHQGVLYGQKVHALRSFITLPTLTDQRFVLALAIHPDETRDLRALAANRWELVDPARLTATTDAYQQFIQGSKGEFGIAKTGYVESRCGWFSDRSICYLASGRPVLAQETGFSRFLPSGEGLLAFETVDQAVAGVERLNADYATHARAARALAERYFDSDVVLTRLLEQLGVTSRRQGGPAPASEFPDMTRLVAPDRPHIADNELREALETALARHFDRPGRVPAFERRRSPYQTSAALEEIDV